jgi:hypothetical protein
MSFTGYELVSDEFVIGAEGDPWVNATLTAPEGKLFLGTGGWAITNPLNNTTRYLLTESGIKYGGSRLFFTWRRDGAEPDLERTITVYGVAAEVADD